MVQLLYSLPRLYMVHIALAFPPSIEDLESPPEIASVGLHDFQTITVCLSSPFPIHTARVHPTND